MYDTEGEVYYDDARKINPNELPDFDLICGGFPCQKLFNRWKKGADLTTQEELCSLKLPESLPLKNLNICCLRTYPDC